MKNVSDQELVDLYLQTGHNLYFAEIYTRHYQRVYHRCLMYTESHADAQDFAQEIFMRLSRKLNSYKGEALLSTWLHTMTVNYCIDQLRRKQRIRQHIHNYARECAEPDDFWGDAEDRRVLLANRVLAQLNQRQRDLLLIKYEQGNKLKEMALDRDTTASAVKMRVKRARDRARILYDQIVEKEGRR